MPSLKLEIEIENLSNLFVDFLYFMFYSGKFCFLRENIMSYQDLTIL